MQLYLENETYKIRQACFHVYRVLGHGFLEAIYQECLELQFAKLNIPFESQKLLQVMFEGKILKQTYKADLICYDQIIVEIKAVKAILPEHKAQIINYLRLTGLKLGLLVNFGAYPKMEIVRLVV